MGTEWTVSWSRQWREPRATFARQRAQPVEVELCRFLGCDEDAAVTLDQQPLCRLHALSLLEARALGMIEDATQT